MTGVLVVVGVVGGTVGIAGGRWLAAKRLEKRLAAVLEAVGQRQP